jgi:hypothetical protein
VRLQIKSHGVCLFCSKIHTGKHLSGTFYIQNGLKEGDALSPLLLDFGSGCSIRKIQENQVGLKLHGTHHMLMM